MTTQLSKNQRQIFRYSDELLQRNQELIGHRLKGLFISHSQVNYKLEGLAKLMQAQHEEHASAVMMDGVIAGLADINQSMILLSAQIDHFQRIMAPLAAQVTQLPSHLSELTQAVATNSRGSSLNSEDRELLKTTAERQSQIEEDVKEIKGSLAQILGLLQGKGVKAAVGAAASKGAKVEKEKEEKEEEKVEDVQIDEYAAQGEHAVEEVLVEKESAAQGEQAVADKGKKIADVQVAEPVIKDDSNKITRKVVMAQRLMEDEKRHKQWKKEVMGEGSSATHPTSVVDEIDPILVAAATGESLEYVEQQFKQAAEDASSMKMIKEAIREEVEAADAKTKKLIATKKLAPADVLKEKQAEFDKKLNAEKEEFLRQPSIRKQNAKIVQVQASVL